MEREVKDKLTLGIDIGGTNIRAGVVDLKGAILGDGRRSSRASDGFETTIGQAASAAEEAMAKAGVRCGDLAAAGAGLPGIHRSREGITLWNPNFADGWRGRRTRDAIQEAVGLPVRIGNDVNVACLGECEFGAARGVKNVLMITLGTGIGGAIVVDGELVLGATEGAGEIGHTIIEPDGPECCCGSRGCFEVLAAKRPIINRALAKLDEGRSSTLQALPADEITPAVIVGAAKEGDELACEVVEETAYYIGLGLTNAINLLNPEMIIVGGGIALAGDILLEPVRRTVTKRALPFSAEVCRIVAAQLGDDAGVIGAATLARKGVGGSGRG
jgi:glucokinase